MVVSNLLANQYILIQFKVQCLNGDHYSISYVQIANKDELNIMSDIFNEFWDLKNEDYHKLELSKVIFSYKILSEKVNVNQSKLKRHTKSVKLVKSEKFNYSGYNLPLTMDITK